MLPRRPRAPPSLSPSLSLPPSLSLSLPLSPPLPPSLPPSTPVALPRRGRVVSPLDRGRRWFWRILCRRARRCRLTINLQRVRVCAATAPVPGFGAPGAMATGASAIVSGSSAPVAGASSARPPVATPMGSTAAPSSARPGRGVQPPQAAAKGQAEVRAPPKYRASTVPFTQQLKDEFGPLKGRAKKVAILDFERPLIELDKKIAEVRDWECGSGAGAAGCGREGEGSGRGCAIDAGEGGGEGEGEAGVGGSVGR